MNRLAVVACLAVLLPLGCSLIVSTDGLSGGDGADAVNGGDARTDTTPPGDDDATSAMDATSDAPQGCRRVRVAVTCSNSYTADYDPPGTGGTSATSAQATEVIALGMYIPTSETVDVVDRRTSPHTLFVSSYKSVAWRITTMTPGALVRVIVSGYEASTVAAPDGVKVENMSPRTPYADSPDEQDVAELVVDRTGSPWTAFAGCYYATSYELHDDCS